MEVESKILLIFFSTFGSAFREAAKNLNVKTMHDGFETAMIELKEEDWRQFIEEVGNIANW